MARRAGASGDGACARAEGYKACTGAERRKKARQGLGLGFKEKRRERETAAGAMAINGRGGHRRF
jgi:NOL1/NOP2/fmu family ribosome biogenesis protein